MALALFDLDNTLIAGDSDHSWGQFLIDNGYVDAQIYACMNDKFYADYTAGTLDIYRYLEFSLQFLTTLPRRQLDALHTEFMRTHIAPMQLGKATALLNNHRNAGDRLVIITSTNRFVVEPICHALGVKDILATELIVRNGAYTGEVDGVAAFREGKVARLQAWLENNCLSLEGSTFYSDSINDLPLLMAVDIPIAVDPDSKLRGIASEKKWKVISLRD